jgi:tetratricopeptide (TPR) repeat protein
MLFTTRLIAATFTALLCLEAAHANDFADCTSDRHKPDTVQAACARIIENPSETPQRKALAHVHRGKAIGRGKNWTKERDDYLAATKLDPNLARAHAELGRYYVRMFAADDFANDYLGGIVDQTLGTTRAKRAEQDLRPALEHINRAITLEPRNLDFYGIRGEANEYLGQKRQAIDDYTKALEKYLEDERRPPERVQFGFFAPTALTKRQNLWMSMGEHRKVIEETSMFLAKYPGTTNLLQQRAKAYAGMKEFDRAIGDSTTVIQIYETPGKRRMSNFVIGGAYASRGELHAMKNEPDKAIADYRRALEMDPGNFRAKSGLKKLGVQ